MRFKHELTIPPNTLSTAPVIDNIYLVKGVLQRILIGFAPGCFSMAHVVFKDGLVQISPSTPEKTHHWDAHIESVPMNYDLEDLHHEISILGWSPGTRYQHILSISFDVSPAGDQGEKELLARLFTLPSI